jgi:conjugative relaxase-like TrwC/TraI family protein
MPVERTQPAEFAARLLAPSFSPQAFSPQDALVDARANSRWHGTNEALRELGLRQGAAIRPRELTAVLSGRHVRTGVRVLPAGEIFDLVFTAPNSLSILWSHLAAESRVDVEDVMLDSSAVLLDHLTADHPVIGGIRPARAYVSSLVLHAVGTTTAGNGTNPPLLHVHCCLFAVLDETGALTRPDEATLSDEEILRLADAIGEAELAYKIGTLGYPVRNTAGKEHSFEIAGIPQKLLDADFWQNVGCALA